ncbi:hypothetical protein E4T47_03179 [Aureobasidium subglaciale]|nr:hypothetical protein E4T47_03179 [Aureobasidium subglaciale]
MSQSTIKPKSSTSEVNEPHATRRTIKRCASDEDDDTSFVRPAKAKKTTKTKKQLQQDSSDSDDSDDSDEEEDENEEDSEDEKQSTSKKSKKPVPTIRKRPWNMRVDSEDDEDEPVNLTNKSKKSKAKTETPAPSTANKSTAAKQKVKPSNNDDSESDSEEEEESSSEEESNDEEDPKITISEYKGDMFAAPSKALLLHACNCQGSWNKGIAYAFQKNYPDHYSRYYAHCRDNDTKDLIGTCLIIPPQKTGRQHWVGCLFTSRKYGRGKDKKDQIVENTENAVEHMVDQLEVWQKKGKEMPIAFWMPKINSGLFRVPWAETKKIIEDITCKGGLHLNVVDKK